MGVGVQQFFSSIIADVREQTHRDGEIEVLQRIDPIVVDFDKAVALGLALRELVDNAIRHGLAGEKGQVTVGLTKHRSELLVWVEDDGPTSRPDRAAWRGQGLGLAVVDLLAEQLQAELLTKTADTGGTRVELRVPLNEVSA